MKLVDMTVKSFTRELSEASPAPGGGSVAALAGSLAAALGAMVARLTVGKALYEASWQKMERVRDRCDALRETLIHLVDRDAEAYNRVIAAYRLPKASEPEKTARSAAIAGANRDAAEVPLTTLETIAQLAPLLRQIVHYGNPNCITDAGVAVEMMRTGAMGAAANVNINLPGLGDAKRAEKLKTRTATLLDQLLEAADNLDADIGDKMAD
jgi:formiminotetrahydrofolate cyclodeaminase